MICEYIIVIKMNCAWKFVYFEFWILCITISVVVTGSVGQNGETSKVIANESAENLTLPCHPSAFQNLTLDESDFEWVTDNDIPIFSKGRLSPFIYLDRLKPLYSVVNNSLILRYVPYENITFTCRSARLHVNYTYFIQADTKNLEIMQRSKYIEPQKKGETIILPCLTDNEIGKSTAGMSYTWLLTNNKLGIIEVISLNQRMLLRNNTANFRISEDRSLIVPNFTPNYHIGYECHSSTGQFISYLSYDEDEKENSNVPLINQDIDVARGNNNVTLNCSADTCNFKKQTLFVGYGVKGTVLPCPAKNINENASSEWTINRKIEMQNYPSLLFLNKENFESIQHEYYEINDDRSLIIKLMTLYSYGVYTCRWSTGEQYVYNITNEITWNNHTVWVNPGENITLPCPLQDPKDREFNLIDWKFHSVSPINFWEFQSTDGKMFPLPLFYTIIPDNIKISDDKTSLIVSNITSDLEGDYACTLFFSNTIHWYTIRIKSK